MAIPPVNHQTPPQPQPPPPPQVEHRAGADINGVFILPNGKEWVVTRLKLDGVEIINSAKKVQHKLTPEQIQRVQAMLLEVCKHQESQTPLNTKTVEKLSISFLADPANAANKIVRVAGTIRDVAAKKWNTVFTTDTLPYNHMEPYLTQLKDLVSTQPRLPVNPPKPVGSGGAGTPSVAAAAAGTIGGAAAIAAAGSAAAGPNPLVLPSMPPMAVTQPNPQPAQHQHAAQPALSGAGLAPIVSSTQPPPGMTQAQHQALRLQALHQEQDRLAQAQRQWQQQHAVQPAHHGPGLAPIVNGGTSGGLTQQQIAVQLAQMRQHQQQVHAAIASQAAASAQVLTPQHATPAVPAAAIAAS